MNRKIYFLYDNMQKGFCHDTHRKVGGLDKAIIYVSEKNALASIESRKHTFINTLGYKPKKSDPVFWHENYREALARRELPRWGYTVVEGNVTVSA